MPRPDRYVDVDGVRLATYDLGGDGPPLFIAHAVGFHAGAYRRLAALLRSDFHCWAMDARGHGQSTAPASEPAQDGAIDALAWERMSADTLAVVEELGLVGAVGFGHSLGGATHILAEASSPGTFSRLICYEPALIVPGSASEGTADLWAARVRRRRAEYDSMEAAATDLRAKLPMSLFDAAVFSDYIDGGFLLDARGAAQSRCHPEVEAAAVFMGYRQTTWEVLDRLECPFSVLMGEPGRTFWEWPWAQSIAQRGHGTARSLEKLSHFGPLEDPGTVSTAVRKELAL